MWCDLNRDLCKVWITIIDHVHCSVYNVISNYLVLLLCHVQHQGGASGQCALNRNLCKDWIIIIGHVHCSVYNVISNYLVLKVDQVVVRTLVQRQGGASGLHHQHQLHPQVPTERRQWGHCAAKHHS